MLLQINNQFNLNAKHNLHNCDSIVMSSAFSLGMSIDQRPGIVEGNEYSEYSQNKSELNS